MTQDRIHCSHFVLLMALISDNIFWAHRNGNIVAESVLFNSQTLTPNLEQRVKVQNQSDA